MTRVYVYLQLPGTLEVVTAGFFEQQDRAGITVGAFVYNPRYLARPDAVPVEPFELPLRPGRLETVRLGGIFGALRDAAPDAWGRRIIARQLAREPTEIDCLLHSPEDRAGALAFGRGKAPPPPVATFNRVVQLDALLAHAEAVQAEERAGVTDPAIAQMEALLQPGTSLGGARPKNVVEADDGLWVAKFPAHGDRWNNARVEAAMLVLARECGLVVAEPRVVGAGGRDVLLVKRFDRTKVDGGYLRHRMVSALTVLGAEEHDRTAWSYPRLADELRRRSRRPDADLKELFQRVAFNALISNVDDHPRNHALIATDRDWELSPAYDLTPAPPIGEERRDLAMSIGRHGRYANRENLLSAAARYRLTRDEASGLLDRMTDVVRARWHDALRAQGVTQLECERLARAFVYPGFVLDPDGNAGSG